MAKDWNTTKGLRIFVQSNILLHILYKSRKNNLIEYYQFVNIFIHRIYRKHFILHQNQDMNTIKMDFNVI